ncbi:hypothetical protein, partial [Methylobacterium nonmethylotrophicum]
MPLSLKLPRRNPEAPRPSLRERYAALKGSAAKVMGKEQSRHRWPRLAGGGEPSKAMSTLIEAHQLAYARCLHGMGEDGADMAALRQAEEEAFRALLHAPLTSDTDRGCYAAAVIERENGLLVRCHAGTRNDPLSVAYRNLRFGEHAREPEETRHIGRKPEAGADPILAAIEAHRAAHAAWHPLMCAWSNTHGGTPEYAAAEAADAAARRVEREAFRALLTVAARNRTVAEAQSRAFSGARSVRLE